MNDQYLYLEVNYSQNAKKALEKLVKYSSESMEDISDKIRTALRENPEDDSVIVRLEVPKYKEPVTVKAEHVHGNYSIYVSLIHHPAEDPEGRA